MAKDRYYYTKKSETEKERYSIARMPMFPVKSTDLYVFSREDDRLDNLSFVYAKKAAKEYEKDKRMNPIHIVHDLSRVYTNVTDRGLRDHINDLVKKGLSQEKVLEVFANWLKPEIKKLYRKHKHPNNV